MTWLALRALLGGWARSAWAFICRYPLQAALLASLACNVWLWRASSACQSTVRQIPAAAARARAAQVVTNQRQAKITGAIARESDAQAPAYSHSLRAAADAHAVRLRAPATRSPSSDASLRGSDPAEPGVHGSDQQPGEPSPELVCRTPAEDSWIIDKVGRFAQMHADAQAMIAAGVALPEPN